MAWIKATGSTCYDESGITFPVKQRINWGKMSIQYCWLQLHTNQPPAIVFDDRSIEPMNSFIAADNVLAQHLIVCEGDLIESADHNYNEDTKRCLAWARPITLNGQPAQISGVKLIFGIVHTIKPPRLEFEWAWETIRRIVCRGGEFKDEP